MKNISTAAGPGQRLYGDIATVEALWGYFECGRIFRTRERYKIKEHRRPRHSHIMSVM